MKKLILTTCLCVLLASNFALADLINLPVKWSQVPAFDDGFDYPSNHPSEVTRADDFTCEFDAPIVAVRWWGSYANETTAREEGEGFWKPMDISFHLSDLGTLSLPINPPLIPVQSVLAQEVWTGFYDLAGEPVYRYDAYLDDPFDQALGTEYFIDIDDPCDGNWGWHEAFFTNENPHAVQTPNHVGPWSTDLVAYVDLAFELMVPEPATIALLGFGALSLLRSRKRSM